MVDLVVGVVSGGSVYDDVLFEMLDRLGIAYKIAGEGEAGAKYPAVLLARHTEAAYSTARQFCKSEADILIAEKGARLESVLALLQGAPSEARENFDLLVNKEEESLLSLIRAHFFAQGLPLARKWYWPKMATMGCVLTHDIDWLHYSPFHKQVLGQSRNPVRLIQLCYGGIRGKNYGWNIPEMVKLESDRGFRSTFLFQTSYWSNDLVKKSVHLVKDASFELALHGAHSSHKDAASLTSELDSFRQNTGETPRGLRYHILKFKAPLTWELEVAAGLEYDATFYYNEFFGFRAGTCFPYRPFSNGSRLPIIELPTAYMDWTALHEGLGGKEQLERFEFSRKKVEEHHGVFVTNFHNTYINKATFPHMYSIFSSLLDTAKTEGYWVATAEECARWWNMRAAAQVNPRLDSGEVLCSPSEVDLVIEREGREPETLPSTAPPGMERSVVPG